MRLTTLLSALLAGAAARAVAETVPVFIQPITSTETAPALLAEISHDSPSTSTDPTASDQIATEVLSYEAPEIPEGAELVRIGAYDRKAGRWTSPTTVISAENFGKGYSPHFVLTLDANGQDLLGVACRGVRVDAGYTRDFGPQAKAVVAGRGKQPELNKPVVLSPEGKKVVPEEKTLLQKYGSFPGGCRGLILTWEWQVLVGVSDWYVCHDVGWRWRPEVTDRLAIPFNIFYAVTRSPSTCELLFSVVHEDDDQKKGLALTECLSSDQRPHRAVKPINFVASAVTPIDFYLDWASNTLDRPSKALLHFIGFVMMQARPCFQVYCKLREDIPHRAMWLPSAEPFPHLLNICQIIMLW
jgi:hypothetical protein